MTKNRIAIFKFLIVLGMISFFTWGFFEIADDYQDQEIRHFDSIIIEGIQNHVSPFWTHIMLGVTLLGSVKWIVILTSMTVMLLFLFKHRLLAVYVAVSISCGGLFNWLLKWIFKRERPDIEPIIQEQGYSFPSGHSMGSFIFYGTLAFILFKLYKQKWAKIFGALLAIFLVFFIGISRIYLGVHYPSDIVGGFTAGAAWTTISIITYHFLDIRRKRLE
ncbi:phosphatase PAP2 family protein [Falsibacillus albus]|uniref:Phosphatase PAP2 family protein n=2 Tax=Falsibacillus albus TaxID=2478915 RepID=A0A3L7JYC2_9BACI|nr:phosphatase PAP2 family protein [Falsibacillus albus]